jgi:GTP-binding protein
LGKDQHGKTGADRIIKVPVGTIIRDATTGELLGDLKEAHQQVVVAAGGRGGKGNAHFVSSTHRSPRFAQPGEPGEDKELEIELRLLADVGIIGLPNAGKSTLTTAISAVRPKIADYPFTTLYPHLGLVRVGVGRSFVVADIPGLIEGASKGAGLGHHFLRHLQRTRLLWHVIDVAPLDESVDPVVQARAVLSELRKYDEALYRKPRWLVLNKMDLVAAERRDALVRDIARRLRWKGPVFAVSAVAREGLTPLLEAAWQALSPAQPPSTEADDVRFRPREVPAP